MTSAASAVPSGPISDDDIDDGKAVALRVDVTRIVSVLGLVVALLVGTYAALGVAQAILDLDDFPVAVLDLDGELQVGA